MSQLQVGVIGYGYWGPNLVRNFTACPTTHVRAVADRDPKRRAAVKGLYPTIDVVEDPSRILTDPAIDAVAIVTPLSTHFAFAKAALENGKHVLVEKPLAASSKECDELTQLARARGLTLMVDHTFVYTAAVQRIKAYVDAGELGRILYFDAVRINLGLFQPDSNVIWDLSPHDLAILDYVLGFEPRWVAALGACHYKDGVENMAYITVGFDESVVAHLHVNWVSPIKVRRIMIAGSKKMVVYDDTEPSEKIKLYDAGMGVSHLDREGAPSMLVEYRTGDVLAPHLDGTEALSRVTQSFEIACRTGIPPLTDGAAGSRVVRLIEAAQRSLQAQGSKVML